MRTENGWLELITMLIFAFDNIERRTKLRLVFLQVECWPFDLKQFSFRWCTHACIALSCLLVQYTCVRVRRAGLAL